MDRSAKSMKRPWGVHTIADVVGSDDCRTGIHESRGKAGLGAHVRYVRAIPEPYHGNKIVAAWWVLTGRAFALVWPQAGDLEEAISQKLSQHSAMSMVGVQQQRSPEEKGLPEYDRRDRQYP
jgi:hypothetical protein